MRAIERRLNQRTKARGDLGIIFGDRQNDGIFDTGGGWALVRGVPAEDRVAVVHAPDVVGGADGELAERTAETDLTIGYVVTGAPGGKVAYSIRLDHGTTTLDRGAPPAPSDDDPAGPVTFELDYDTAAAIARGELAAQVAFMQGRLKLVGNVDVLIRDGAVLDGVADALGDLRADTEF